MDSGAFQAEGFTVVLDISDQASEPIQILSAVGDVNQYRIYNSGESTCFVSFSTTFDGAEEKAGISTTTQFFKSLPIIPGSIEIFSGPDDAYFSAVCQAGEVTRIYITPGRGM